MRALPPDVHPLKALLLRPRRQPHSRCSASNGAAPAAVEASPTDWQLCCPCAAAACGNAAAAAARAALLSGSRGGGGPRSAAKTGAPVSTSSPRNTAASGLTSACDSPPPPLLPFPPLPLPLVVLLLEELVLLPAQLPCAAIAPRSPDRYPKRAA